MNIKLTKKQIILGFVFCGLLVVGFIIYMQRYQRVVSEGAQLLDQHCIALNPLIIRRKQAFIDGVKTLQASGSAGMEPYLAYQDQYLAAAKDYVKLEKLWLAQFETYLNEPEVSFLLGPLHKEAGNYQSEMYHAEFMSIKKIMRMLPETDPAKQRSLQETIRAAEQEERLAQQGYDLKYGTRMKANRSFLDQFITQPVAQCPESDQQIPDVEKELEI